MTIPFFGILAGILAVVKPLKAGEMIQILEQKMGGVTLHFVIFFATFFEPKIFIKKSKID